MYHESEHRYFGIYRATVAEVNDPEDYGRIKMIVPQVTGLETTEWAWPVGGALPQIKFPYGTFVTTANQSLTQNTATVVSNWQAEDVNKISLSGTRIYVEETGDYFLQFSVVFAKSSANAGEADIWIRKNGVDVANTNTTCHLAGSDAEVIVTVGFILDLDANDYIELVASASTTSTYIKYHAPASTPTRPACPGVIATINLVGKWRPQVGKGIWAMYEGGDPNFPLWIGEF